MAFLIYVLILSKFNLRQKFLKYALTWFNAVQLRLFKYCIAPVQRTRSKVLMYMKLPYSAGLKVNDQLVAHATRFLIVRLKNHV